MSITQPGDDHTLNMYHVINRYFMRKFDALDRSVTFDEDALMNTLALLAIHNHLVGDIWTVNTNDGLLCLRSKVLLKIVFMHFLKCFYLIYNFN